MDGFDSEALFFGRSANWLLPMLTTMTEIIQEIHKRVSLLSSFPSSFSLPPPPSYSLRLKTLKSKSNCIHNLYLNVTSPDKPDKQASIMTGRLQLK